MRMYLASNGSYFPTQDEAKKAARSFGLTFEPVDVPIKLRELAAYLNTHMVPPDPSAPAAVAPVAGFDNRVFPDDGPVVPQGGNNTPPRQPAPTGASYTDQSVKLDDLWDAAPLTRRIELCTLTMHDVAVAAKRLDNPPAPPPAPVPAPALTTFDIEDD